MGVRGETLPCMIILRYYGGHPDHSETKEAGSSGCLMYHFRMVLQMLCAIQADVAPRMGARDRLTVRMVAKMLAMEMLLEVAARRECLQANHDR